MHGGHTVYSFKIQWQNMNEPEMWVTARPFLAPLRNNLSHGPLGMVDLQALHTSRPPAEVVGPSGQVYKSTSMWLRPHQEPRRRAIFIVESWWFDPAILITVAANCATLGLHSPADPPSEVFDAIEWAFLAVFTAEMLIKVCAFGFLHHEGAYLRNPWCQLDFVIVTLAWLPILIPSFGNYSAFRALRALRPLRSLKFVPGMPMLIESIMAAVPRLTVVAGLCGVVLLVFGIVGVELFKGELVCSRARCLGSALR